MSHDHNTPYLEAVPTHTTTTMAIRGKGTVSTIVDSTADLKLLRTLYSQFHFKCQQCNASLRIDDAKSHIETWLAKTQCIPPQCQVSKISCWRCGTMMCIGCGSKPRLSQENIFTSVGVVNHCCPQGGLYGLWLLLSRFDDEEVRVKRAVSEEVEGKESKNGGTKPGGIRTVGYSGVGYALDGWHEMYYNPSRYTSMMAMAPEVEEDVPDDIVAETLRLIKAFLPPHSIGFDVSMHTVLLRSSLLLDRTAALLRNDSIVDWTERKNLYWALLEFLKSILPHPILKGLIFECRHGRKNYPGIRALAESSRFKYEPDNDTVSASLFTCLENIHRQARIFLELSKKSAEPTMAKESIRICQEVVSVYDSMIDMVQFQPQAKDTDLSWTKFATENKVTFTDDVLRHHYFQKDFSAFKGSNRGRLNTIGKEIANMATSLPTGVFLKVAESRSDVMKVLIIGSEGSPYSGGLFIFDLFLDANYPSSPPRMRFVLPTADDDFSNFNPNLHPGGNVCLSILNTWDGTPQEMWQPNKSTILTVLISVQAMILGTPHPYANEPGRGKQTHTIQSINYNQLIQCKTVKGAMIFWLSSAFTKSNATIWKDISETYFRYNGKEVLQEVLNWSKMGNKRLSAFLRDISPNFAKKKKSKEAVIPEAAPVNLLEELAKHLEIPIKKEDYTEAASPDTPRKRKTPSINAESSKKAKVLDADPLIDDEYAFFADGGDMGWWDSDTDAVGLHATEWETFSAGPMWVYTGPRKQKDARDACNEFGVQPAKSIEQTIQRLESRVNEGGVFSSESAKKWGKVVS